TPAQRARRETFAEDLRAGAAGGGASEESELAAVARDGERELARRETSADLPLDRAGRARMELEHGVLARLQRHGRLGHERAMGEPDPHREIRRDVDEPEAALVVGVRAIVREVADAPPVAIDGMAALARIVRARRDEEEPALLRSHFDA